MPDLARSPRAVLVATLTTGLLAVQYAGVRRSRMADREAYVRRGPFGDGFFTSVVLHAFGPFYGGIFHSQVRVAEDVAPWVVGLLVACVVAWLVIVVVSRKGILAAFVGGWLAVILGTWAANMASALVFIQTTKVPDDGPYSTQILARRVRPRAALGLRVRLVPRPRRRTSRQRAPQARGHAGRADTAD